MSTLYGDVVVKIPEGTRAGKKIRLRGKGIVSMQNSSVHGDQYVTVQIQIPTDLSMEAKAKLREFQQIYQKIRFYQNLIIRLVYIGVGVMVPHQIADPVDHFLRPAKTG